MSDDLKNSSQASEEQKSSTAPVWIFALSLLFLFGGGVYFDRHSGWFDKQVYSPFANAAMLDSYQPKSGAAAMLAQGKKNYDAICGTCHGPDGLGKPGQAPPLSGSEWVIAKGHSRLARIPLLGLNGPITIKGEQMSFPSGMAAMGAALSDADLAAVLTYIRGSWGNKADEVTADDVKAVRAAVGARPQPVTAEQLKALPE